MASDICVQLGRRIRSLREKQGLTQQQLADLADISRMHVSQLENGNREAGLRVLKALAESLSTTASQLLSGL